jgi:hypothetical protein
MNGRQTHILATAGLMLFVIMLAECACAKEIKYVGFVSSVKGVVSLQREGLRKDMLLEGMDALREGDLVKIDSGASVAVNLCRVSLKTTVAGKADFAVSADRLKIKVSKSVKTSAIVKSSCEILMNSAAKYGREPSLRESVEEASGAMMMLGSAAGAKSPILSEITRGIIIEESIAKPYAMLLSGQMIIDELNVFSFPEFRLITEEPADIYIVTIVNAVGAEIFRAETAKPYFVYPETATPLLAGGWYLCQIKVKQKDGSMKDGLNMGLSVYPPEYQEAFNREQNRLISLAGAKDENPDAYILLGNFYERFNLPHRAYEAYVKAAALQPGNPILEYRISKLKVKY